jgi:uncharacterized phage protein gp47/JayE
MAEIPKLVLDPDNDELLVQQYKERTLSAFGGSVTDDSPGSFIAAMGEGSIFAVSELLYYLNMLPEATALEVLRLCGISRNSGTKATGRLSFLLSAIRADNFTVPAGYVIPYVPAGYTYGDSGYQLLETLVIPAGALQASVPVQATLEGSLMNNPAYGVTITATGFNFVQSITNPERIDGGSDLEPLEDTIARAQTELRSRDVLVSETDYQQMAEELAGNGVAKVIPFLSSDLVSIEIGQVHVFVALPDGTPPTLDLCTSIQAEMQKASFIASRTWVSPVENLMMYLEVVVKVDSLDEKIAQTAYRDMVTYLSVQQLGIGNTVKVKKLEAILDRVEGIQEVSYVRIDNEPLDRQMPNAWTVPKIEILSFSVTDPTGKATNFIIGPGVGDPD